MDNGGQPQLLPVLLELVGAALIAIAACLVWLPLGLAATGILMILSAVAVERAGATEKPVSRVG